MPAGHHMPVHSSYPPPGPGYPNHPSHPMNHPHHHSSRPNGPPPGMPGGGPPMSVPGPPPNMAMSVAPPEPIGPPTNGPVSNGHHGTPAPSMPMSAALRQGKEAMESMIAQLKSANENTWMLIGAVSEQISNQDDAASAFDRALKHNPNSVLALNAAATLARSRDKFDEAVDLFQRILNIKQDNGEVWGSMGHCLLMKDDLPKAYTAYQQALHYLPNPKEPKLWYGIGILYDRYGSFEHAEEAFSSVLKMDPDFEKANEIFFRLGIIYKHQRKYPNSLDCFRRIISNPPRPLTSWDIWFQLGHVYELDRDYVQARDAYMRVLGHQPDHAKVLQQLGWLYHQPGAPFANHEQAIDYLTKSLETDPHDAQSWYLLGRAFMASQRYNKAYEAYQQAVYRDGRNPTFWCSIGVLYFQINQYRDALDAYSRAIRLNPYISEVWFNLGSLYESCNNQISDAIDAYVRAQELEPQNAAIKQRLQLLQSHMNTPLPPPPAPVDVHPSQYSGATPSAGYAPNGSQPGSPPPGHGPAPGPQVGLDAREQPPPPGSGRELPSLPTDYRGPEPSSFRGGAIPPPLAHVDESRGNMSRHAPLAPIDIDRQQEPPREMRESYRDGPNFAGGAPGPNRFDPTTDGRGGSPRRRQAEPGAPYPPGYPPQQHPGYRDREREDWERRGGDPRAVPAHDPRGPSPRPGLHPADPRAGPPRDPRDPRDPREFARSPEGYPPYGGPQYERGGPYPPGYPGPRDLRARERFEEPESKPPIDFSNGRQASLAREHGDMRAPSPAASTSSKASARRKVSDKREDPTRKMKKAPDSKGRRLNGEEPSPRPSPAPSSVRASAPNRAIDEDYDEGVDALMTLANDRRAPSVATDKAPSPVIGTKRPDPPSPDMHSNKKSKASPPVGSPTRQTVIEVLNAPRPPPPPTVERAESNASIEVLNAPRVQSNTDFMKLGRDKDRRSPERPAARQQPSAPTSPWERERRERGEREQRVQREEEKKDETKSPKSPVKRSQSDDRAMPRSPSIVRSPTAEKAPSSKTSVVGAKALSSKGSVSGDKPPSSKGSPMDVAMDKEEKVPSKPTSAFGDDGDVEMEDAEK
ncbi:uncharacterized protein CcaverHIS019_0403460 [Cutaneotrichosporon cavernicola]|uniref:Cytochrome c-type biogenesis protein H TPR domain-containing protein n=1 Tax=Cutaneotrichosporon cavernicola TaxID=279322 RepID=A0AA48L3Z2_9TREE|nr:uncharacterized protein CcaverHIS019_0403460 [Cutaneotrichosporon cavernicola]BEI91526.1 hypothetical protein CcaverHIS019_0403460 [Cutaneotrichosporon cavernicola]